MLASTYITDLASRGTYCFTTDEAVRALGTSPVAARAALRRLERRGDIAHPFRGFHVIVPPEYRRLGCLPAEQFVPQLMAHLKEPYYVALLSAAELHGAAHQRPQSFQVMLRTNRRPLACGKVRVQFVARRDLETTPTVERNTPRGTMRLSSPEATALELVGYADQSGGLDNVASVLADLAEAIDPKKLATAARLCPIAWVQRLGYLLEVVEQEGLAKPLDAAVRERAVVVAPLVRAKPIAHAERNRRWKLAVNARVEPDQ